MAPKVAIVFYSMYGHIKALAEAEKAGLAKAGIEADIFQVAETLPQEVLTKMHAPPKSDYPVIDAAKLQEYDAFLFGIPTRYGNFPAQWKAFWDTTGGQWASGGYWGKFAGVFLSTGTPGGGQESTAISAMSTLAHHGIIYVPLGYKHTFPQLTTTQGEQFGKKVASVNFARLQGSEGVKDEVRAAENGATTTKNTQEQNTNTVKKENGGEKKKEEKDSEGPCGLPSKCAIL